MTLRGCQPERDRVSGVSSRSGAGHRRYFSRTYNYWVSFQDEWDQSQLRARIAWSEAALHSPFPLLFGLGNGLSGSSAGRSPVILASTVAR
jgi:hypothetical protein